MDVKAGNGDGQQAYDAQHGKAAADVLGDIEAGEAVLGYVPAQGAVVVAGHHVDAVFGLLFAVLGEHLLLQDGVGQQGLQGGAGLGDDAQAGGLLLHGGDHLFQVGAGHVVAGEHHVGTAGLVAVEGVDDGPGAQVGAADADNDKERALAGDVVGAFLDLVQFLASHRLRKSDPAGVLHRAREKLFSIFFSLCGKTLWYSYIRIGKIKIHSWHTSSL